MIKFGVGVLCAFLAAGPAAAQVIPFPDSFRMRDIDVEGVKLHVRVGGNGPGVVLIHGFGDTGDMWEPLAAELAKSHTVVVPDLRGMGLSSHPEAGYDKKTQAADIRAILARLDLDHTAVVGHDIGTMVAFAYAERYPDKTDKLVVMDAPVPGVPMTGTAVCPVAAKLLPSTCCIESGFSTEASAIWATFSELPLENSATMKPFDPMLRLVSWPAPTPS